MENLTIEHGVIIGVVLGFICSALSIWWESRATASSSYIITGYKGSSL